MINVKTVEEFWLLFLFIVHLKLKTRKITHAQNIKSIGPITHNSRFFGLILPTDFEDIFTNLTIYKMSNDTNLQVFTPYPKEAAHHTPLVVFNWSYGEALIV